MSWRLTSVRDAEQPCGWLIWFAELGKCRVGAVGTCGIAADSAVEERANVRDMQDAMRRAAREPQPSGVLAHSRQATRLGAQLMRTRPRRQLA